MIFDLEIFYGNIKVVIILLGCSFLALYQKIIHFRLLYTASGAFSHLTFHFRKFGF